jgi:hypothetical protein
MKILLFLKSGLSLVFFLLLSSPVSPVCAKIPVTVLYKKGEEALERRALEKVEAYFKSDPYFIYTANPQINHLAVDALLLQNPDGSNTPFVLLKASLRPSGKTWGNIYASFVWWPGGKMASSLNQLAFDKEGRVYLDAVFQGWTSPSFDEFDSVRENIKTNIRRLKTSGRILPNAFNWLLR